MVHVYEACSKKNWSTEKRRNFAKEQITSCYVPPLWTKIPTSNSNGDVLAHLESTGGSTYLTTETSVRLMLVSTGSGSQFLVRIFRFCSPPLLNNSNPKSSHFAREKHVDRSSQTLSKFLEVLF